MRSPGLLFIIAATSSGTVASVPQESAAIEAVTSADGYARWEAARAIGFVPDAVAVKYLDRVLESTHDDDAIDAIVIKGLMRLATSEAHDVVERAAHAVDLTRAVLAADALKRWPAKN
jgi:HEAT repeat protein